MWTTLFLTSLLTCEGVKVNLQPEDIIVSMSHSIDVLQGNTVSTPSLCASASGRAPRMSPVCGGLICRPTLTSQY